MNNWEYFLQKYGTPIGKGAQCQVYRKGDTVYKVLSEGHELYSAMHEGFALALAQREGIPVSNIHGVYTEGGHIVMEMDYVAGKPVTDLIIEAAQKRDRGAIDAYVQQLVDLQVQLHNRTAIGLGAARQTYAVVFANPSNLSDELRGKLFDRVNRLPDGSALCHNDYHALNVINNGGKLIIIDWDSAMTGDPAGDVAHTFLVSLLMNDVLNGIYDDFAGNYLDKYLAQTHMKRERVEAWMPVHAAILYSALINGAPQNAKIMEPYLSDIQSSI
jgi:aminoglycoside phosphotransferase (APT) family kinase protein